MVDIWIYVDMDMMDIYGGVNCPGVINLILGQIAGYEATIGLTQYNCVLGGRKFLRIQQNCVMAQPHNLIGR